MSTDDQAMSLVEHLAELRTRLIRIFLIVAVGSGFGLYFSADILKIIRKPILPFLGPDGGLVFTAPADLFMASMKVGVLSGIILTCPFWLYQLWAFLSPGLYRHEKKFAGGFIVVGSFLFLTGVCFVYFFVYPAAFEYLLAFGDGVGKPMITIDQYLEFFVMTTLMFGVAFELPLILFILALMGIVDADFLGKKRRYAIVILAFVAAILTPPDVVSMITMLIPLYVLYEISIIAIRLLIPKMLATNPSP